MNNRMEATMEKRRIIREYLEKQAHKDKETEGVSKDQAAINARWEKLNNGVFEVDNGGLGFDGEDYDELELAKLGDLEKAIRKPSFFSGTSHGLTRPWIRMCWRLKNWRRACISRSTRFWTVSRWTPA